MGRKRRQTDAGGVRRPDKTHPDPGHLPGHCSAELGPDHYVSSSLISSSPSVSLWSPKSHSLSLHLGDYGPLQQPTRPKNKAERPLPWSGRPCMWLRIAWLVLPASACSAQSNATTSGAEGLQTWPCREAAPENPTNIRDAAMELQV